MPSKLFFFTMAFDPIFRWLRNAVVPRGFSLPAFLQPTPSAYADDAAVAASYFRTLMPAVALACRIIDSVTGMYLNHIKMLQGSVWE